MEDIIKQTPGQSGSDGHLYKRLRRIEIRASNQEYQQLRDYAHAAQYSNLAQYLREAGLSNKDIQSQTKKMEALRSCQFELNKIGVNINQISHHLNANPNSPITAKTLIVLMQIQKLAESIYKTAKATE